MIVIRVKRHGSANGLHDAGTPSAPGSRFPQSASIEMSQAIDEFHAVDLVEVKPPVNRKRSSRIRYHRSLQVVIETYKQEYL